MNKRHNGILGLIRLMKGQRHRVLLAVVAGVLAQGGTLASLALGAVIVGQAIVAPDADTLITGCAGMALLVLFTAGARWWQGWASHDLAFMLIEKLQMAIFDGLERAAPLTASGQRLGNWHPLPPPMPNGWNVSMLIPWPITSRRLLCRWRRWRCCICSILC
ncbi:hypothetical protein ERHA54_19100 [Erwinia rhapontici]|uniref:hypothetical protein n=1 Tax=Erwinia rhapontici TaxID=55212 RepID=UPI001BB41810|nr:hypothetical protein [Erwinia rhapontici]BCQ39307.1 hypothetical protein ERHA54_19100 [Erwinia rhapontici]